MNAYLYKIGMNMAQVNVAGKNGQAQTVTVPRGVTVVPQTVQTVQNGQQYVMASSGNLICRNEMWYLLIIVINV